MSNIKLKDHNWDTTGVYDSTLGKTQRQVNADLTANKVNTSDYAPATKTSEMTQSVGKDSNGKLWTTPVSSASIVSATEAWLANNITQETGYVIDDSFSVSGAAADAGAVGDCIESITNLETITETTYFTIQTGIAHSNNWGRAARSSNTAYITQKQYPSTDGIKYYFDDSIYKLIGLKYREDGTYFYLDTAWGTSSPYSFSRASSQIDENVFTTIEIRRQDNANFSQSELSKLNSLIWTINKNEYPLKTYINMMTPVYVSSNGNDDTGTGSKSLPFKTINGAIAKGYRNIYAKPDQYNETISLSGGSFSLKPWIDSESFDINVPNRLKIRLIKGTKLTLSSTSTTDVVQGSFTAADTSNLYKVFVSKELSPTSTGDLSVVYNALVAEDTTSAMSSVGFYPYGRKLYIPVLTEAGLSNEGTFWYTPGTIKIHKYAGTANADFYVPDDTAYSGVALTNMEHVHLENVSVLGSYDNALYFNKCNDIELISCDCGYCAKGMGFAFVNSNVKALSCVAFAVSVDGFNFHEYGASELKDCTAFNCGDDGASYHQGCTGIVYGGDYHHNFDGGITPAFGSKVNIIGAYTHDNAKGICFYGSSAYKRRTCLVNSCLSVNNSSGDIYYDAAYDIIVCNSSYGDKVHGDGNATITEYGNTHVQ